MEHRRVRRAPASCSAADIGGPDGFAIEIEAKDSGFPEEDVDVLAVGCGCGGGESVTGIVASGVLRFGQLGGKLLPPDLFATGTIQAQDLPFQVGLFPLVGDQPIAGVGRQVDPFSQHDRARRPRSGHLGLPDHVLTRRPCHRQTGFLAVSQATRIAEAGHIGSLDPHRAQRRGQCRGQHQREGRASCRWHDDLLVNPVRTCPSNRKYVTKSL